MTERDEASALTRFEWSIRALAQEASVQVTLYPAFACCTDELALEFDETNRALTDEDLAQLTPEALEIVQRIDTLLESSPSVGPRTNRCGPMKH